MVLSPLAVNVLETTEDQTAVLICIQKDLCKTYFIKKLSIARTYSRLEYAFR